MAIKAASKVHCKVSIVITATIYQGWSKPPRNGRRCRRGPHLFIHGYCPIIAFGGFADFEVCFLTENRSQRSLILRFCRHDEFELEHARPRVRLVQLLAELVAFGFVLRSHVVQNGAQK